MADEEAIERFTALYDGCYSRVYAYAVSRFGSRLADEVVSEVFLIAWQRICDVPEPALPWLLTVARNTGLSQFRAAARQQSIAAELATWASEAEADVAVQVADRLTVIRALAALSEQDRELLTLVAWHGLSASAAAQVVGCSRAAYFVRLHRARRRLERGMTQGYFGPSYPGQLNRYEVVVSDAWTNMAPVLPPRSAWIGSSGQRG